MYRRLLLGAALLMAGTLTLLLLRRLALDHIVFSADYDSAMTDPRLSLQVRIVAFPVRRQAHAWSCGPATISMVLSYLNSPVTEAEYLARVGLSQRGEGMLPRVFLRYLQDALPGRRVTLITDESPLAVCRLLHSQIARGIPVPVYFSTVNAWIPQRYDTHYSVVTGMALARGVVHIANVYGFEEDVALPEFLSRLSFRNYQNEPLLHRLGRLTGYIAKNNVYVIGEPDNNTLQRTSAPGALEGARRRTRVGPSWQEALEADGADVRAFWVGHSQGG